ncbi:MAG: thermonuclease family protein [Acetobacteraceae bacterium]
MISVGRLRLAGLLAVGAALILWQALRSGDTASSAYRRPAGAIVGYARVIDGDTLDIAGRRIRLHGVDAPESSQQCEADGTFYRCGTQAALALADLLRGQMVECQPVDRDRYQRIVARCRIADGGTRINAWLVRQGYAVAYRQYSYDYMPDEIVARVARRGLWAGTFQMPWDYRAGMRTGRASF